MNRVTCVAIAVLTMCLSSFGQDNANTEQTQPQTKIEAFFAKKGNLIVKDFYDLGTLKGNYGTVVSFKALVVSEPGQETEKVKGLKVEVEEGGQYDRPRSAFLDVEEIESMKNAADYQLRLAAEWAAATKEYTEVVFRTKGELEIGFYQKGIEQTGFAKAGSVVDATCFLKNVGDLARFSEVAGRALEILASK